MLVGLKVAGSEPGAQHLGIRVNMSGAFRDRRLHESGKRDHEQIEDDASF